MDFETIIDYIGLFTMAILGLSFFLAFIRVYIGPSIANRVVASDIMAAVIVAIISVYAIVTERFVYLDVALVVALLAFLGTVAFAVYIERRP